MHELMHATSRRRIVYSAMSSSTKQDNTDKDKRSPGKSQSLLHPE